MLTLYSDGVPNVESQILKMELCNRSEMKLEENNLKSVNIEEIPEALWKLAQFCKAEYGYLDDKLCALVIKYYDAQRCQLGKIQSVWTCLCGIILIILLNVERPGSLFPRQGILYCINGEKELSSGICLLLSVSDYGDIVTRFFKFLLLRLPVLMDHTLEL